MKPISSYILKKLYHSFRRFFEFFLNFDAVFCLQILKYALAHLCELTKKQTHDKSIRMPYVTYLPRSYESNIISLRCSVRAMGSSLQMGRNRWGSSLQHPDWITVKPKRAKKASIYLSTRAQWQVGLERAAVQTDKESNMIGQRGKNVVEDAARSFPQHQVVRSCSVVV